MVKIRLMIRVRVRIIRVRIRDAGTTGAAGASAPLAFCIFNFVGAVRVQTRGATGAQNFYNRHN
jgi:hypothetical protein